MFPTLFHGTKIRLTELAPGEPRRGEIYVFEQDESLVAHRCCGRSSTGGYRFRGDRGGDRGQTVPRHAVLGRVECFYLRGLPIPVHGAAWRGVSRAIRLFLAAYGRTIPRRLRTRLHGPVRSTMARLFVGR
jgi:hypothetical protein